MKRTMKRNLAFILALTLMVSLLSAGVGAAATPGGPPPPSPPAVTASINIEKVITGDPVPDDMDPIFTINLYTEFMGYHQVSGAELQLSKSDLSGVMTFNVENVYFWPQQDTRTVYVHETSGGGENWDNDDNYYAVTLHKDGTIDYPPDATKVTVTNSYEVPKAKIYVEKKIRSYIDDVPETDFTIVLYAENPANNPSAVPMDTLVLSTDDKDGHFTVLLSDIDFGDSYRKTLYLKEESGGEDYWSYDSDVEDVIVTKSGSVYNWYVNQNNKERNSEEKPVKFTNTYHALEIFVEKNISIPDDFNPDNIPDREFIVNVYDTYNENALVGSVTLSTDDRTRAALVDVRELIFIDNTCRLKLVEQGSSTETWTYDLSPKFVDVKRNDGGYQVCNVVVQPASFNIIPTCLCEENNEENPVIVYNQFDPLCVDIDITKVIGGDWTEPELIDPVYAQFMQTTYVYQTFYFGLFAAEDDETPIATAEITTPDLTGTIHACLESSGTYYIKERDDSGFGWVYDANAYEITIDSEGNVTYPEDGESVVFNNSYYDPVIDVNKTASPMNIYTGESSTYTITVTNTWTDDFVWTELTDDMFADPDITNVYVEVNGSEYTDWEIDGNNMYFGEDWGDLVLAPDDMIVVTYDKSFDSTGTYENTVSVLAYSEREDMASDEDDATVTVSNRPTTRTITYDVTVNYYIDGTTTTLRASNSTGGLINGMLYDVEDDGFVYASLDFGGDTYDFVSADSAYAGTIDHADVVINLYYATSGVEEETEETEEEVPLAEEPEPETEPVEEQELPTTGGLAIGLLGLMGAGLTSVGLFIGKNKRNK